MLTAFSLLMLATGLACLMLALRGSDGPLPKGGLEWMASATSALLIIAAGFLLAMSLAQGEEMEQAAGGMNLDAPDFVFTTLEDGLESSLGLYEGKVVLINFWATWCQPCIAELPELDQLHADYEEQGLVILTLSDETKEELVRFSDLLPERTTTGYFDIDGLPEPYRDALLQGRPVSYVVDRAGLVRDFIIGAGNYETFERLILPHIASAS